KGTPAALREEYSSDTLRLSPLDMYEAEMCLAQQKIAYAVNGMRLDIKLNKTLDALPVLNGMEGLLSGFEVISGSMDDAFIAITGGSVKES
ncbi:MAG: ABC transporter, partial [Eubacteriales bacterium]